MLNTEFGLGNNLNAYKGLRMYNTADNSRRDIGTGANAYVSMADFRGYQATTPVVAGSRAYLTTQSDTLPLFNIMTITVWGGGGGGGGGAVMNSTWNKGADGNAGTDGGVSSVVYLGATLASAQNGKAGGGGIRNSTDNFNGANGAGADGVHGGGGSGGYGANDGTTGARAGGSGGNGGKTVTVWNVDSNSAYLNYQLKSMSMNIGAKGSGGSGGSITQIVYGIPFEQRGGSGNSPTDSSPGYITISWT
jgi:hypothetical protein